MPFWPPYLEFHSVAEHLCHAQTALSSIDHGGLDGELAKEKEQILDCQSLLKELGSGKLGPRMMNGFLLSISL